MNLKRIKSLALFVILFTCTAALSQNVSTVVTGPSTFDDCLTLGPDGNIYASRYNGSTVTKITPAGVTTIFASGFSAPNGTAFGANGFLYVPSALGNRIDKVSPQGVVTNVIPSMSNASAILFLTPAKMLVACYTPNIIYLADTTGTYSPKYTGNGLNGPIGLRFTSQGRLIIGNFNDGKIFSVDTSTGIFTQIADLPGQLGFIEIVNDAIYSTGFQTNKIYRTKLNGDTATIAGTGAAGQVNGPALSSTFNSPNGIVRSVTGDTLYVSDYGSRSLRMITGVTIGLININTLSPERFTLMQNYPNPFNPETRIRFEISGSGGLGESFVSLKIFDITGKETVVLVNNMLKAGTYEYQWNSEQNSSGIYFYRLSAGDFSETKRMILIK